MLRASASNGNTKEVNLIVECLARDRHEAPNLRLYGPLILVNVDPQEGSIFRVNSILQEMNNEGYSIDAGICHDVLKVLSVHPDYLLRIGILEYMQQRWLEISDSGYHDLIASLLREGQLELAIERLSDLRHRGVKVQGWLRDMAVYTLLEAEEIDEAFQLVERQSEDEIIQLSKGVWLNLLDVASSSRHHAATAFVWNDQVRAGYLNPPSGICFNTLCAAAAVGDIGLATDVFRVLGQRSTLFGFQHYEELIRAYLTAEEPDLNAAFSVLTIMAAAKIEPSLASTRPIYTHLQSHPDSLSEAVPIITELHSKGRKIPIAALNVILEALVDAKDFEQALRLYKTIHTFETPQDKDQPRKVLANVDTFNHLFRGATRVRPAEFQTAMFLASEQLALGIKPNSLTYDRLILVSLKSQQMETAWSYFDEMEELGWFPRPGTAQLVGVKLAEAGDERCWDVLQRAHEAGDDYRWCKRQVELAWERATQGQQI